MTYDAKLTLLEIAESILMMAEFPRDLVTFSDRYLSVLEPPKASLKDTYTSRELCLTYTHCIFDIINYELNRLGL